MQPSNSLENFFTTPLLKLSKVRSLFCRTGLKTFNPLLLHIEKGPLDAVLCMFYVGSM